MRKNRTPEQWQALLDQQRDSGLSAPQLCKREAIGYASFFNWRKRLSEEPVSEASRSDGVNFLDVSSLVPSILVLSRA